MSTVDLELIQAIHGEIERRRGMGLYCGPKLCPKVYAHPNYAAGERKYCLRDLYLGYSRCFQHCHEDPKFKTLLCKNGKEYHTHKNGIHPAICPKEPTLGLCYFCIEYDSKQPKWKLEAAEFPALSSPSKVAEAPKVVEVPKVSYAAVAAAVDTIELEPEAPEQNIQLGLSSQYLQDVIIAARDAELTLDELTFDALDIKANIDNNPRVLNACNFLYHYLCNTQPDNCLIYSIAEINKYMELSIDMVYARDPHVWHVLNTVTHEHGNNKIINACHFINGYML